MKLDTLLRAKGQASKLLYEIDELVRVVGADTLRDTCYDGQMSRAPGKHTAAIRRASMDLTRVLADLRQNR